MTGKTNIAKQTHMHEHTRTQRAPNDGKNHTDNSNNNWNITNTTAGSPGS